MEDGDKLIRVVDIVLIVINKQGTTDVLVESTVKHSDGTQDKLERLPGTKRRPDENFFVTAQRILKRQLKMSENCVNIDRHVRTAEDERKDSDSFPGIATLYRKRIICAEL